MMSYTFVNGVFLEKLKRGVIASPALFAGRDTPETASPGSPRPSAAGPRDDELFVEHNNSEIVLRIPKNTQVTTPIHLHFLTKDINNNIENNIENFYPRIKIIAEENSSVTIIEEHSAENAEYYITKVTTELHAETNANIHYYKIQDESVTATHEAHISVQQKQVSSVKTFFSDIGSVDARENLYIRLAETGAECFLSGIYYLKHDKQKLENNIHVDHIAAHGKSSMLYKGMLDKKSRANFNGKVSVDPQAKKIQSQQANHNLLLSNDAEVATKPELEINADDVKCAHGATVGQLAEEALFYLRTRGLQKEQALELLTHAFAMEVINQIEDGVIRSYIQERVGYVC